MILANGPWSVSDRHSLIWDDNDGMPLAAIEGRRDYAETGPAIESMVVSHEISALESVLRLVRSGDSTSFLRAWTPSWRWHQYGVELERFER